MSNVASHQETAAPAAASNWRSDLLRFMQQGVESDVYPGAVLQIQYRGNTVFAEAVGMRSISAGESATTPMKLDTVFDVAGLTGAVVTTTLLMKLFENGKLKLEDRVSRYVQGFGVNGKSAITIQDLLAHVSGLTAWSPFFEELVKLNSTSRMGVLTSRGAKEYVYNVINRSQLKYQTHSRQLYSDLGLIVLGQIIEILTGMTLDKAAQKMIFQPLGMKGSSYIDLSLVKRRGIHPVLNLIAPTEDCTWRKRVLCGEVHDDNAWAMGGVAGHSGLFLMASDIGIFANEILSAYKGNSSYLRSKTVQGFFARPESHFELTHAMGWELPNRDNGLIDVGFSTQAVGSTGFTGCSMWLEPDKELAIILMSNRINPSRNNRKIQSFRQELMRSVLTVFRG